MSSSVDLVGSAKSFWAQHFEGASSVEADNLTSVLVQSFGHTLKASEAEKPHIVHSIVDFVISSSSTSTSISQTDFSNFVQRFGPLDLSLARTQRDLLLPGTSTIAPYFHGELSREASEELLKADGTYLIRSSSRYPSKLCLVYAVSQNGKFAYKHVLIGNSHTGYILEPQPDVYADLATLIKSQKSRTVNTVPSKLNELSKKREEARKPAAAASSGGAYAQFDGDDDEPQAAASHGQAGKSAYSVFDDDDDATPAANAHAPTKKPTQSAYAVFDDDGDDSHAPSSTQTQGGGGAKSAYAVFDE